jgi:hypothetical protein
VRISILAVCLCAALNTASACAQASSSDVAFVYIASTPTNSKTNEIVAYTAAPNGSLSPVPGSPFHENIASMAVNGKYLVASSQTAPQINAYSIENNGALTYAASTNYAQYNNPSRACGVAGQIFFDRTGETLYVQEFNATSACANTAIASFTVDKSTGGLNYLGLANTGAFPGNAFAAYFVADNLYAYAADDSACTYWAFYGFSRSGTGLLSDLGLHYNLPTPPSGVSSYLPSQAAADPTNHVAFTMQPANPPGCASGPLQLATYTADAGGNLNTTNTREDMPATSIVTVYDMKMAPSGKLLAVAGQEGLQVFRFNGASPITKYTGLLTSDPINRMFWDNNNHLYAISQSSGKLFVFTITPTSHEAAPGSPYTVSNPSNIVVQPLSR